MRPLATPGTGSGVAVAGVLLLAVSRTTGSATTTSWPTLETPRSVTRRNSRTPSGASAAAVIFSLAERTGALGSLAGGGGTTVAVRPAPSTSQPRAPAKFIWPSTVTSAVVPRCTATGVQWVTIGNDVWAGAAPAAAAMTRAAGTS